MGDRDGLFPVLVIDDERDMRDGCERVLSPRGCQVIKAADGQAGLAILDKEPVSIVLLDLKMPGLDGLEVLRRIRESHPHILVIVVTGYATVETAIEAMKMGAYDFISKPFRPDQLRLTVDRAIERKKLTDEAKRLEQERQKTLVDLDKEKSRTRTIIRALPHGVAVTAADGQVALMNPAFGSLIGLEPSARPGQHISSYIKDKGLCDLVLALSRGEFKGGKEDRSYELTVGDDRYLMARCTEIPGEEGECLGAVMVVMDITEWKMLDKLRTDFLAKVSHELRSPLSTIDLQLALLLGEGGGDDSREDRHLLKRAKERTQGLIFLIRDLLDMSRIEMEAGKQTLTQVSLEKILGSVMDSLRPQAQSRQHSLSLKLPKKELPPLNADPVSLESVFTNLVANAINYTQDGGTIEIEAGLQEKFIRARVRDNGFGIEPEHLDKIFDKFYRVKNEKTRYITGTGLGLSIVKAVVEGLGGSLAVDSVPDKGTTFTILLPLGRS